VTRRVLDGVADSTATPGKTPPTNARLTPPALLDEQGNRHPLASVANLDALLAV
jgi:hypothetical protein